MDQFSVPTEAVRQVPESFSLFYKCKTWCSERGEAPVSSVNCLVVSDSLQSWTVARQAPLSLGFPRQEYWSGLPLPSPGHRPTPGIELESPALQAVFTVWALELELRPESRLQIPASPCDILVSLRAASCGLLLPELSWQTLVSQGVLW